MDGNTKTYSAGGETYDIPEEKAADFLKAYPEAQELKSYKVGKDTFDIPLAKEQDFLKTYPKATATFEDAPTAPGLMKEAMGKKAPATSMKADMQSFSPDTHIEIQDLPNEVTKLDTAGRPTGGKEDLSFDTPAQKDAYDLIKETKGNIAAVNYLQSIGKATEQEKLDAKKEHLQNIENKKNEIVSFFDQNKPPAIKATLSLQPPKEQTGFMNPAPTEQEQAAMQNVGLTVDLYSKYLQAHDPEKFNYYTDQLKYLQEGGFFGSAPEDEAQQKLRAEITEDAIQFRAAAVKLKSHDLEKSIDKDAIEQLGQLNESLASLNTQYQQAADPNAKNNIANEYNKTAAQAQQLLSTGLGDQLQQVDELNDQAQAVESAGKTYIQYYPAEASRRLAESKKQAYADAVSQMGWFDDPRAFQAKFAENVTNQVGRAVTDILSETLALPQVVTANNKYGWTDRLADFSDISMKAFNKEFFPETTKMQGGLIGSDHTMNWDLLLPKTVRTLSDMALLVGGAEAAAAPMVAGGMSTAKALSIGTIASSFTMTAKGYYDDAIKAGMSHEGASAFAMPTAMMQGVLELINPEAIVFREALTTQVVKNYTNMLLKGATQKEAMLEAGKFIGKNMISENVQELSQNFDERIHKAAANKLFGSTFQQNDFTQEALETVILTSIVSGLSAGLVGGGGSGGGGDVITGSRSQLEKRALYTAALNPQELIQEINSRVADGLIPQQAADRIARTVTQLHGNLNILPGHLTSDQRSDIVSIMFDKMKVQEANAMPGIDDLLKKKGEMFITESNKAIEEILQQGQPKYIIDGKELTKPEFVAQLNAYPGDVFKDIKEGRVNIKINNDERFANQINQTLGFDPAAEKAKRQDTPKKEKAADEQQQQQEEQKPSAEVVPVPKNEKSEKKTGIWLNKTAHELVGAGMNFFNKSLNSFLPEFITRNKGSEKNAEPNDAYTELTEDQANRIYDNLLQSADEGKITAEPFVNRMNSLKSFLETVGTPKAKEMLAKINEFLPDMEKNVADLQAATQEHLKNKSKESLDKVWAMRKQFAEMDLSALKIKDLFEDPPAADNQNNNLIPQQNEKGNESGSKETGEEAGQEVLTPEAPITSKAGEDNAPAASEKQHRQNIHDKFRKEFKAKGINDEQITGALALLDARAKSWASEEKGRKPEQYYQKIADVKSGEFQTETPKQYQLPDGSKVMGVPTSPEVVNGFYSPIEKNLLETKVENKSAAAWLQQLGKGDEVTFTGLKEFLSSKKPNEQVKKSEILDYLKNNRIQIVEVVKGGKGDILDYESAPKDAKRIIDSYQKGNLDSTEFAQAMNVLGYEVDYGMDGEVESITKKGNEPVKFHQYQEPGDKSNYKEVLITMPNGQSKVKPFLHKGVWIEDPYKDETLMRDVDPHAYYGVDKKDLPTFKSSHFDEPNILAHLRMNTRTDAAGKKTLFIEEVQSDWGQKGKKEGFKKGNSYKIVQEGDGWRAIDAQGDKFGVLASTREQAEMQASFMSSSARQEGVSPAPFVTDTNAWTKLALKVALKEAVKQGEQMQRSAWDKMMIEKELWIEERMKKLGKLRIDC